MTKRIESEFSSRQKYEQNNGVGRVDQFPWAALTSLLVQKLELVLRKRSRQQFKRWSSAGYFDHQLERFGKTQTLKHLEYELKTFCDEYGVMLPVKRYLYTKHGVDDAHQQTSAELCANFEKSLRSLGLDPTRANLETNLALKIEHFLADKCVAPGSILITFSPRGDLTEGYPGHDAANYVFVNIFEKLEDTSPNGNPTALMHQYLSWDNTDQLWKLSERIATNFAAHPNSQPRPEAAPTPTNPEHRLIASPLLIEPAQAKSFLNQANQLIYAHQEVWPVKPANLPTINFSQYQELLTGDSAAGHQEAIIPSLLWAFNQLQQQTDSERMSSQVAETSFDKLVELTRLYLLKWAEKSNQGLEVDSFDTIFKTWQAEFLETPNRSKPTKRSRSTTKLLSSLALEPTSGLARASSVFHCVVMTPTSTATQIANIPTNPASLAALGEAGFKTDLGNPFLHNEPIPTSSSDADFLTPAESLLLSHLIELRHQLLPTKILDKTTNQISLVYIKFKDPNHHPQYDGFCYFSSQGELMGPCQIPLTTDNLIGAFFWDDNPNTKYLDEGQYHQLQQKIAHLHNKQAINQSLGPNTGVDHQQLVDQVLEKIAKKILRINFSQLVAGITDYGDQINALPLACQNFLNKAGPNKLSALKLMLKLMDENDLNHIVAVLTEGSPRPFQLNSFEDTLGGPVDFDRALIA